MKGYLRVASLMPDIKVGNPKFNSESIKEEILKANTLSVKLCVLPELCITGLSLKSLCYDRNLLNESLEALYSLLMFSSELDIVIIVSLPFEFKTNVYEVAAVIKSGEILGFIPNNYIDKNDPNFKYFSILKHDYQDITLIDDNRRITYKFPFANNIIFKTKNFDFKVTFNAKITTEYSAQIICDLSSIPETVDVDMSIRNIKNLSQDNNCTIITTSPGTSESTELHSYFGRSFICEFGDIIVKNDILTNHILVADIDLDKSVLNKNCKNETIPEIYANFNYNNYILNNINEKLFREFDKYPYINKKINPYNYSMHIINILAIALAKRVRAVNASNIVLGISGGLDSTIALLVAQKTIEFLSLSNDNINAVFMPGFGTSNDSISNVKSLLNSLNIKYKTIDITNSVNVHFNDINHNVNDTNVTFENAQARERTQILMDIANDVNGIVIGTGDLSEIALGFSTYNGDQMSMYNVNGSLPKSLIRYILNSIADENLKDQNNTLLANSLKNILHTKISPELLPADNGIVLQRTEEILGNYEIHDFILYNYLRFNYDYEKLVDLTLRTFTINSNNNNYTEDYIINCVKIFFNRFYKSQYKRSSAPPSPDIGLPSLDSHYSFNIPSDIEVDKF